MPNPVVQSPTLFSTPNLINDENTTDSIFESNTEPTLDDFNVFEEITTSSEGLLSNNMDLVSEIFLKTHLKKYVIQLECSDNA